MSINIMKTIALPNYLINSKTLLGIYQEERQPPIVSTSYNETTPFSMQTYSLEETF